MHHTTFCGLSAEGTSVSNLVSITRLAILTLAVSTGLAAQEGWEGALKIGGGPTTGGAKTVTGNAGFSFAPTLEFTYHYNKTSAVALGMGYRFFPGDIYTVSSIPTPQVAGQTYEARLRKPDAKGFELSALYRHSFNEDLYVQGGLRLGLYKVNFRDTGSRITYGTVPPSTAVVPTAIVTIMDDRDKKTTSFGLLAGMGYRLTENFSVEANVFTVRLGDPLGITNTSLASELSFGIRF